MKHLAWSSLAFMFLCVCLSTQACADRDPGGQGIVYAYGYKLDPPYDFSNVGGDTLFLNGVPYRPKRGARAYDAGELEDLRAGMLNDAQSTHEFNQRLSTKARSMYESGATLEECIQFYADVYDSLPDVGSVKKTAKGIIVEYKDGVKEEIIVSFKKGSPPDRRSVHEDLIKRFMKTINDGGMVAFGVIDGLQYELHTPKWQLEKTNKLLGKLAEGQRLTSDDVLDTPLSNEAFRAQMSQRLMSHETKE